jgi:NDP-sugar pyrophosphorylase family protein
LTQKKKESIIGDLNLAPFFDPSEWEVLGQPLPVMLEKYTGQKGDLPELLEVCGIRQLWELNPIVDGIISGMGTNIHPSARIEDGVEITGNVIIEENTHILAGSRLKGNIFVGAGSFIGNNALLRGTVSLGRESRVTFATDVKDVIAGRATGFGPLNFFGNSWLGSHCFFGGVVRVSNYRLNNRTVSIKIGNKLIDTRMRQFGCVIGDRVSLGVGCIILPGRLIERDTVFGPHFIIDKNRPGNRQYYVRQSVIASKQRNSAES